jgi:EpsI family protein
MSLRDQPAPALRIAWTAAAASLAAGTAAILILFAGSLRTAWDVWTGSGDFGHCLLAVPIAACLAYARRGVAACTAPAPAATLPALGAALGGVLWLVGRAATLAEIEHIALAGILQCLLLAVLGWRVYAALLLPCLYLLLLVPTGDQLVPALQVLTTALVAAGLDALGIANHVDGTVIALPGGEFHVAAACAGFRFLSAAFAFAVAFADRAIADWRRRTIFLALAIAVPVLANAARALGIVVLAHASDHRIASGIDHVVYGWVFFLGVMLALCAIGRALGDPPGPWRPPGWPEPPPRRATAPRNFWIAAAAVTAAAAVGPIQALRLDRGMATDGRGPVDLAALDAPGWRATAPRQDWHPVFPGADGEGRARFMDAAGHAVDVHVVFYAAQRDGAELVGFANALQDARWRPVAEGAARIAIDATTLDAPCRHLAGGGTRRVATVAYWVDGRFLGSRLHAKLAQARGVLFSGRRAAAAILLSAEDDDAEIARRRLEAFSRAARGMRAALEARAVSRG